MLIVKTKLQGLTLFRPTVHQDERGFFLEGFRLSSLQRVVGPVSFVQDNHVRSAQAGVLRGLHFQTPPYTQSKYVWVTKGSIFDVAVDLRVGSPTYGHWEAFSLSAENFLRLFVPRGFAHGYLTLEPDTEVQYKVDSYYAPNNDGGLVWNDPDLNISWPDLAPVLSEKDKRQPPFADFVSPFTPAALRP